MARLKTIQSFEISMGPGITSANQTIASVVMNKTIVFYSYRHDNSGYSLRWVQSVSA